MKLPYPIHPARQIYLTPFRSLCRLAQNHPRRNPASPIQPTLGGTNPPTHCRASQPTSRENEMKYILAAFAGAMATIALLVFTLSHQMQ